MHLCFSDAYILPAKMNTNIKEMVNVIRSSTYGQLVDLIVFRFNVMTHKTEFIYTDILEYIDQGDCIVL